MQNESNSKSASSAFVFRVFPTIDHYFREKRVIEIRNSKLADVEWVATEKIRGANFSFITDGNLVKAGKRNSLLDPTKDKFYFGWQEVFEQEVPRVKQLFRLIQDTLVPDIGCCHVFGELFGGTWPYCCTVASSLATFPITLNRHL